jgi:DNA-directed RNA polymerase specialized sigma24 family protein
MLSVHALMQESQVAHKSGGHLGRKEEQRLVAAAIDRLPETARLVLGLRYYEAVRPPQIAAALGMPEDDVRGLLVEALQQVVAAMRQTSVTPKEIPAEQGGVSRRNGKGRAR